MKISEMLKQKKIKEIFSINEEATVDEAVRLLNEKKVGALLVVDGSGELNGILSQKDILFKVFQEGQSGDKTFVKGIMTEKDKLVIATVEDRSAYVMNVMTKNKIRHLPVFDGHKLVGILSIGDIIKSLMEESESESKLLREYIKSPYGVPII